MPEKEVIFQVQIRLMSAATDTAQYDVFITDAIPAVSVVRDDGTVRVTRWNSIKEAVAYLIGAGCDLSDADDTKDMVDRAISAKYAALR